MVSYSLCFQFTFNVHSNISPFAWKHFCLPGLLLSVPQTRTQNIFKLNSNSPSLYSLCRWVALSFIQLSKPETWPFTRVIPSIVPHDHLKDLSTILSSWPPVCCLVESSFPSHLPDICIPLNGFSPFISASLPSNFHISDKDISRSKF